MVFVRAQDLGLSGTERAEALDADLALAARLEAIRVAAAGEQLWRELRLERVSAECAKPHGREHGDGADGKEQSCGCRH